MALIYSRSKRDLSRSIIEKTAARLVLVIDNWSSFLAIYIGWNLIVLIFDAITKVAISNLVKEP
jgi:hypothetical protein